MENIPSGNGLSENRFQTLKFWPWWRIFLIALVIWVGWSLVDFFWGEQLFPQAIRGHYLNSTYISSGINQGKDFLITDDSFYYTYSTSSPGKKSSGVASLFNKAYYGFYQSTQKGKMESRQKLTYTKMTPVLNSYWINNKIWLVGAGNELFDSELRVINPDNGNTEMMLADLRHNFPQFQQGILSISKSFQTLEDLNFQVSMMDGSSYYYFPAVNQVFNNYRDYLKWLIENKPMEMNQIIQAVYLSNDTPKKLMRLNGPRVLIKDLISKPYGIEMFDHELGSLLSTKTGSKLDEGQETSEQLGSEKFVEGEIIYEDEQYALILHQENIKDLSPRILTLVNIKTGQMQTITQAKMLPEMRTNSDDSFSTIFFTKDKIEVERSGNLLFYKVKGVGVLVINVESGQIERILDGSKL